MLKLLLFLALFSLPPCLGDEKLVEIVCHETDQPDVCAQCLQSAPGADVASKSGIAAAVIGSCLEAHGTSLVASMTSLGSQAKEDRAKRLFQGCSNGYSASNKDLASAAALLKSGEYDEAERAVTRALYRHESCLYEIGAYKKVIVPSKVAFEMKIYEDLCQVADRIIEKLK